jgi:hypothetical protein
MTRVGYSPGCIALSGGKYGGVRFRNIRVTAPDGTILWEGLPDLPPATPQADGRAIVAKLFPVDSRWKGWSLRDNQKVDILGTVRQIDGNTAVLDFRTRTLSLEVNGNRVKLLKDEPIGPGFITKNQQAAGQINGRDLTIEGTEERWGRQGKKKIGTENIKFVMQREYTSAAEKDTTKERTTNETSTPGAPTTSLSKSADAGEKGPNSLEPKMGPAIDLLSQAHLPDGVVKGDWKKTSEGIESGSQLAILKLPYKPSTQYDYRVSFTCKSGGPIVDLLPSFRSTRFGWNMQSGACGFARVGGHAFNDNESTYASGLSVGHRYTVLLKIRDNYLAAWIDGGSE